MTALSGPILFNNSTGSDSAASGCGPATAISIGIQLGAGTNTTQSASWSGTISVGDLVYYNTSTGRKFNVVASVTNSSPQSITFDDNWDDSLNGTGYVGGKRATFDNADSRQAFADSNGWVFETETDQSLTSQINGPPLSGTHEFRGSANGAICIFSNLKFDNSSATKTVAYALEMRRSFACFGCTFGDATNQINIGITRGGDFPNGIVANCIFQNCTSTTAAMYLGFSNGLKIDSCVFRNNAGSGLYTAQYPMWVTNSVFHDNGNDGWTKSIPNARHGIAERNIFYNNTRDGLANVSSQGFTALVSNVSNNLFISNGRYGWSLGASESNVPASRNVFYNNASGDVSGNTALSYGDNITLTADPFVDAANGDFNISDSAGGGATVNGGGLHDGSSEANAWTLAEAHTNMSVGDRLNIKAGTYTVGGTYNAWPTSTLSSPSGFRGYKNTIGDLDDKPVSQLVDGTDRPLIQTTNASYYWFTNRAHELYENLAFESSTSRPAQYADGYYTIYSRCKFIADPAGSICIRRSTGNYSSFVNCHFDGNGGGQQQNIDEATQFVGCLFENLKYIEAYEFVQFSNSIIRNMTQGGLRYTAWGWHNINGNTFYNIGGNAIEIVNASVPSIGSILIQNNVFHTITGNALQSAANNLDFFADNNLFYGSNYSNTFNLNRNAISEASDPFVDAAGGDYSLVSSSGGYGKAQPNPFEGLAADSRRDIGAIQHADPAGGGGGGSSTPTAGTQVYPFRQFVEADFGSAGGGGGAVLHPLRSN
jgi:hypothetical protein